MTKKEEQVDKKFELLDSLQEHLDAVGAESEDVTFVCALLAANQIATIGGKDIRAFHENLGMTLKLITEKATTIFNEEREKEPANEDE